MTNHNGDGNGNGNGSASKILLRWWPVIVTLLAALAAFSSVKADVLLVANQLNTHERVQTEQSRELNQRLSTIEADIKALLRQTK